MDCEVAAQEKLNFCIRDTFKSDRSKDNLRDADYVSRKNGEAHIKNTIPTERDTVVGEFLFFLVKTTLMKKKRHFPGECNNAVPNLYSLYL